VGKIQLYVRLWRELENERNAGLEKPEIGEWKFHRKHRLVGQNLWGCSNVDASADYSYWRLLRTRRKQVCYDKSATSRMSKMSDC